MPMCEREKQIAAAASSGIWTDELRAHAAECESCGETMLVAGFLQEASTAEESAVPEAGLVWWKAQLRLRREAAERAARPMMVAWRVAVGLAAAAGVWGIATMSENSTALAAAAGVCVTGLLAAAGSALWLTARGRR